MSRRVLWAALAVATAQGIQLGHAAEAECFENWSVASEIVARERLIPIRELRISLPEGGSVVRTTLCRVDGRYTYRLVVERAGGVLTRSEVDAHRRGPDAGR